MLQARLRTPHALPPRQSRRGGGSNVTTRSLTRTCGVGPSSVTSRAPSARRSRCTDSTRSHCSTVSAPRARGSDGEHHEARRNVAGQISGPVRAATRAAVRPQGRRAAMVDEQTTAHVTGTYVDPAHGRVTVGEWADRWLAAKAALKASTRDRYAGILATHVRPSWVMCGSRTLHTTPCRHGCPGSPSGTVGRVGGEDPPGAVHGPGVRGALPAVGVEPGRRSDTASGDPAEKRYLRADQVADLADAARAGRLVVLVLAYTGLRWGELAALKASRVDLMRRRSMSRTL